MGAAITGAPGDKNDAGIVSFDDTQFTVDADGFVQLIGGSMAIDTLTGDDAEAINPDGSGNIDFSGSIVSYATNSKPLWIEGTAASNLLDWQLQVASAKSLDPGDTNDCGVCFFDSDQFSVSSTGFVSLKGSDEAIDSNTGDDSVVVFPNAAGNFNWLGNTVANATHAKPVFFKDSATPNALDLDVQVAAAITGAPGDKLDAGLCSFDDTIFTCDADGYVSLATTGLAETITGDTGGALSPTSNNWNILGGVNVQTDGTGSTLTVNATDFASIVTTEVTSDTDPMVAYTIYHANSASSITFTLPTTSSQGEIFEVVRKGAGDISIAQNADQTIHYNSVDTTTGATGSLDSNAQYDVVRFQTIIDNTDFVVLNSCGSWTAN